MGKIYETYGKVYQEILPNTNYIPLQENFLHFERYDYRFQWNIEMCTPVRIIRENFRKAKAREKMKQLKTLLNRKESLCPTPPTEAPPLPPAQPDTSRLLLPKPWYGKAVMPWRMTAGIAINDIMFISCLIAVFHLPAARYHTNRKSVELYLHRRWRLLILSRSIPI